MKRLLLFGLSVALAACDVFGGARCARAGITTAIEFNVDGGGWAPLGSNAGSAAGPVSGNLAGVFNLMNMSAISFVPAELISANLVLINTTAAAREGQRSLSPPPIS